MDEIIAAVTNQVEVYHQAAIKTLVLHDGPSQAGLTGRNLGGKIACLWSKMLFPKEKIINVNAKFHTCPVDTVPKCPQYRSAVW